MSSADIAVGVYRELESEDFRVLHIIEAGMAKHEYVPTEQIRDYAKVPLERITFTLGQTKQAGLNLPNQRRLHRPHPKLCRIRLLSHKQPCKRRRNLLVRAKFRCRQRSRRLRRPKPRGQTHSHQISQAGQDQF